jgi:hypothetical protein
VWFSVSFCHHGTSAVSDQRKIGHLKTNAYFCARRSSAHLCTSTYNMNLFFVSATLSTALCSPVITSLIICPSWFSGASNDSKNLYIAIILIFLQFCWIVLNNFYFSLVCRIISFLVYTRAIKERPRRRRGLRSRSTYVCIYLNTKYLGLSRQVDEARQPLSYSFWKIAPNPAVASR